MHIWTFRNDSSGYGFTDPKAEMMYYYQLGLDGLFTDFADTGVAARDAAQAYSANNKTQQNCRYRR